MNTLVNSIDAFYHCIMGALHYITAAIPNIVAGIILAAAAWLFLAFQRMQRLRSQLDELLVVVQGDTESEIERLFKTGTERRTQWDQQLARIKDDVEKFPDRLVRLNISTQRRLDRLFVDIDKNLGAELGKILNGHGDGKNPIIERAIASIKECRRSVTVFSFLELRSRLR
jgi:hypothetical protein